MSCAKGALEALVAMWLHGAALAHKPSESYLILNVEGNTIDGQWDIALRDLDFALGLDDNQDGAITWGEVKAKHAAITAYALARLTLGPAHAPCAPVMREQLIDNHSDGAYAVLRLSGSCPAGDGELQIGYRLLFDLDALHRGLLRLGLDGTSQTAVLAPQRAQQQFAAAEISRLTQFVAVPSRASGISGRLRPRPVPAFAAAAGRIGARGRALARRRRCSISSAPAVRWRSRPCSAPCSARLRRRRRCAASSPRHRAT